MTTTLKCTWCKCDLTDEERESPYRDGGGVICDECYHDNYEFECCWCCSYEHIDHQHKLLVVCDAEAFPETDRQRGYGRGVYRIVNAPYYRSDYFTAWLYAESLEWLAPLPAELGNDAYPCGHLCRECQKRIESQARQAKGENHAT